MNDELVFFEKHLLISKRRREEGRRIMEDEPASLGELLDQLSQLEDGNFGLQGLVDDICKKVNSKSRGYDIIVDKLLDE